MNATSYTGNDAKPLEFRAHLAQVNAIKSIADSGSCVIVGRSTDYILRDWHNLLKVFVVAYIEYRVHRVIERRKVSEEQARILIQKTDKSRATFYNYHTEQRWKDAGNYDLCVNSGKLGAACTVKFIMEYLNLRLN